MGDRNDDLKCHICGRAFRLRSSLKVHISTHKRDGILEGKSAEGPNISDRFIQEKSPKLLKNLEGKSVEESSKSDSFIKEETIIKEESLKILEKSFSPKKCQYCEKQFTLRSCLETHIIACKVKSSHCSDVELKKFPSLKNKSLSTDEKNSPSSDEPEDELFDLTIDMDSQTEDEENLSSGTESSKCKERNSLLTEKPDEKLSPNSIERFKDVNRKIDGQEISEVKGTNHISKVKNKDSTDNGLKIGKLKSTKGKQNVQKQSYLKHKTVNTKLAFQCKICSVSYALKRSLCRHVLKCHSEKDYKDCVTMPLKEIHERIHTGENKCPSDESEDEIINFTNNMNSQEEDENLSSGSESSGSEIELLVHVLQTHLKNEERNSLLIKRIEKTGAKVPPNSVQTIFQQVDSKSNGQKKVKVKDTNHILKVKNKDSTNDGLKIGKLKSTKGKHKVKNIDSKDDEPGTDHTGSADTDVLKVEKGQEVGETSELFLCENCGKTFTKKSLLRRHMKYHSSNAKCLTCERVFISQSALSKHCKKCAGKVMTCKYCSQKYFTRASLIQHIKYDHTDTEKNNIQCDVCNKLISKRRFDIHKRTHTGERPYQCELCGTSFVQKNHLRRHKLVHTKPAFQCKVCRVSYVEEETLRRHVLRCHKEKDFEDCVTMQPREEMKCSQCELQFCTRHLLLQHKRASHAKPPVSRKCSYCEKKFNSLSLKILHERLHTGEKPYKCKFCDKRFRLYQTHKVHVRTHTKERPFICKTCGKSFIQRPHLIAHQILHTGEKPFKCQYCGASFANQSNLRAHEKKNCKQTRTVQSIELVTEEITTPNVVTVLTIRPY